MKPDHFLAIFPTRKIAVGDALLLSLGLFYLAYLSLRAFLIPATIDEAFTILVHVPMGVFQILTYDYPEPSANNHVLNTLIIKFLEAIFDRNLLSARLGNLLAGVVYVAAGIWLVRQLFTNRWARIGGLILWLANPFLAEFFALGRGYGMSVGAMAASISFAFRFFQNQECRRGEIEKLEIEKLKMRKPIRQFPISQFPFSFAAAWFFASLGVAANFTLLNFFLCFSGICVVWLLQNQADRRRLLAVFSVAHLLVFLLMFLPVKRMTAANEFEKFGVSGFFQDTLQPFVRAFFYGKEFLGKQTFEVANVLLPVFFGLATLLFLARFHANGYRWTPRLFLAALLPGTVAANVAMTFFTDATWLPARSSTFFYPLLALSFFTVSPVSTFSTNRTLRQLFRLAKPLLIALAISSGICLTRVANIEKTYEWQFDSHTVKVLNYLKNWHLQENRTTPIPFNSHWVYSLSFKFHLQSNRGHFSKFVQPDMTWRALPQPGDDYEFFYGDLKNLPDLADRYEVVWVLEPRQQALFRRKTEIEKLRN